MEEDSRAVVVFVLGETEIARWPLRLDGRLDLSVVDRLARLQLIAQRLGFSVRVRQADPELDGLLDLCGLAGLLRGQVVGQAEDAEQARVEEVVVPDDPVA